MTFSCGQEPPNSTSHFRLQDFDHYFLCIVQELLYSVEDVDNDVSKGTILFLVLLRIRLQGLYLLLKLIVEFLNLFSQLRYHLTVDRVVL